MASSGNSFVILTGKLLINCHFLWSQWQSER